MDASKTWITGEEGQRVSDEAHRVYMANMAAFLDKLVASFKRWPTLQGAEDIDCICRGMLKSKEAHGNDVRRA